MRAIPTLGYPSRTAAVLALLDEGVSRSIIADRIGIDVTTVSSLEASGTRTSQSAAARRDPEIAALKNVERLYGAVLSLVDRYGIEPDVSTIKIEGRYSNGTFTIQELLDRADEVLERAKGRSRA